MAQMPAAFVIEIRDPQKAGALVRRWRQEADALAQGNREQKLRSLLLRTCADEIAECLGVSSCQ